MSNGDDIGSVKGLELKRLLGQMREKMQEHLERAETKYGFDFQAGKPTQRNNVLHLQWTEMHQAVHRDQFPRRN